MDRRDPNDAGVTPLPADLILAVGQHREDALEALYDRYASLTFSLAYRMLGEREAAEDVTQEIFLKAWKSAATYDPAKSTERSWLMTIARNSCIDRLRSWAARPRLDLSKGDVDPPGQHDVWTDVARSLTAERVRGALQSLPAEQRQTIELAYYGGLSQSEIAQHLGIPLGTVKGRLRGAIQKLRALLSELGLEQSR